MQTISSSQGQDQATAANITNPEGNQRSSTAFTRTVSAAYEHAITSAAIREQPTDEAGKPSDTGLIARLVTETQALSVQSEPLTDASQLPAGHTYQPYFWLSQQAHRLMAPHVTGRGSDIQSQVIKQFLMSERVAKEKFEARFEYRFVNYGYTSVDASGIPEKNYGVFASEPVAEGELLGVYSGIGYLNTSESWAKTNRNWHPEYLHQKFSEEMPDYMSYNRILMAGLRGKEQTQRTPAKYSIKASAEWNNNTSQRTSARHSIDASSEQLPICVGVVPGNGRYTPMHFVNSANHPKYVNAGFELISIKTGSEQLFFPIVVAIKDIAAGQELLASYILDPKVERSGAYKLSATEEKVHLNYMLDSYLAMIDKLNSVVPDKPPISPYAAVPVLDLSETIRKTFRGKVTKTDEPSSSGADRS